MTKDRIFILFQVLLAFLLSSFYSGRALREDNMALGNPSGASTLVDSSSNYLVVKDGFSLSYNNTYGTANWVSWHLNAAWKGDAKRCDCLKPDKTLPPSFFKATTKHYTKTGFDRGHICPSDDRDGATEDNAATFLLTNIIPQAPKLNQGTWKALEEYCRDLTDSSYELYIISGAYGDGGTGSKGYAGSIAGGKIRVPAHCWKIVLVLPEGEDDLQRIGRKTRIIAVDMPNVQEVKKDWRVYLTTVDAIEAETGYDFLSSLKNEVEKALEAKVDGQEHQ